MSKEVFMPEGDKELFDILNNDRVNDIQNRVLWDSSQIPIKNEFFSKSDLGGVDPEIFKEELIKATENMKNDNKYYTPNIEDIHVGYEYEWSHNGKDWFISTLQTIPGGYDVEECDLYSGRCVLSIHDMLVCKLIKTPYLTKEQIESDGWKFQHQGGLNGDIEGKSLFIKDIKGEMHQTSYGVSDRISFYLIFDKEIKIVKQSDSHIKETVFKGNCPSINELRVICKLLKIK